MTERLVSVAAVKDWLKIEGTNTAVDARVLRLIDAVSRHILNYIGWDSFMPKEYTDTVQGNGRPSMLLRHWPIISVSSLNIGGAGINASTFNAGLMSSAGYTIGDKRIGPGSIELSGKVFYRGYPVTVTYRAGFEASQEFLLDDASVPISVTTTEGGLWLGDISVKDMAGDAFTKVAADPGTGEYAVEPDGSYTFATVDAGKSVTITYGYVPPDVSQAALDMLGEWNSRRSSIGVVSKNLAGQEQVTFSKDTMNEYTQGVLQPYKNVVPW